MTYSSVPHASWMAFKDRLKIARKKRGFSQEALARRANISLRQMLRYESGKGEASHGNLTAIALALGVSTDWLLGLEQSGLERHLELPPIDPDAWPADGAEGQGSKRQRPPSG